MKNLTSILLTCIILFCISSLHSQAIVEALENKGAIVSFSFRDAQGKEIKSYRSKQLMMPASTNKVLTTTAILHYLGGENRYETKIIALGTINKNKLLGDLVILGSGDPSLGSGKSGSLSADEVISEIVNFVKKSNISEIDGSLIADVSIFRFDHTAVPRYWPYEDLGNYYGAGVYGINWRSNEFSAVFTAEKPGSLIEPKINDFKLYDVTMKSMVKTCLTGEEEEVIYMYGTPLQAEVKLDGCVPQGKIRTEKGAIPNPPLQLISELKAALLEAGIKVNGGLVVSDSQVKSQGEELLLGKISSPVLTKLIEETNLNSNNLFAESFVKILGSKFATDSRAEAGASFVERFLREEMQLPTSNLKFYDGSGLSPSNLITPSFQTEFLHKLKSRKEYQSILNSLPESGKSGTLKNFGNISGLRAKSGSINGVRTYMGYLPSSRYGELSFSVMVNHSSVQSSQIKSLILDLLKEMNE